MAEKISWTVRIDVAAGPKLSASDVIEVEAYDKISFTLDAGDTGIAVDLQPGAAGQVSFLMISASEYAEEITYSPDGGTTTVPLDAPLVLIGAGAISLLGSAPQQFEWENTTLNPVDIEIFVGRDATP